MEAVFATRYRSHRDQMRPIEPEAHTTGRHSYFIVANISFRQTKKRKERTDGINRALSISILNVIFPNGTLPSSNSFSPSLLSLPFRSSPILPAHIPVRRPVLTNESALSCRDTQKLLDLHSNPVFHTGWPQPHGNPRSARRLVPAAVQVVKQPNAGRTVALGSRPRPHVADGAKETSLLAQQETSLLVLIKQPTRSPASHPSVGGPEQPEGLVYRPYISR